MSDLWPWEGNRVQPVLTPDETARFEALLSRLDQTGDLPPDEQREFAAYVRRSDPTATSEDTR